PRQDPRPDRPAAPRGQLTGRLDRRESDRWERRVTRAMRYAWRWPRQAMRAGPVAVPARRAAPRGRIAHLPQWYAIGRGHTRPGTAGHQQLSLLVREAYPVREGICDHSPGLLRCTFATQRSSHANEQYRQESTAERTPRRQAPRVKRYGLTDINAVGTRQSVKDNLTRTRQKASSQ